MHLRLSTNVRSHGTVASMDCGKSQQAEERSDRLRACNVKCALHHGIELTFVQEMVLQQTLISWTNLNKICRAVACARLLQQWHSKHVVAAADQEAAARSIGGPPFCCLMCLVQSDFDLRHVTTEEMLRNEREPRAKRSSLRDWERSEKLDPLQGLAPKGQSPGGTRQLCDALQMNLESSKQMLYAT